jgi:hypothetical protein
VDLSRLIVQQGILASRSTEPDSSSLEFKFRTGYLRARRLDAMSEASSLSETRQSASSGSSKAYFSTNIRTLIG